MCLKHVKSNTKTDPPPKPQATKSKHPNPCCCFVHWPPTWVAISTPPCLANSATSLRPATHPDRPESSADPDRTAIAQSTSPRANGTWRRGRPAFRPPFLEQIRGWVDEPLLLTSYQELLMCFEVSPKKEHTKRYQNQKSSSWTSSPVLGFCFGMGPIQYKAVHSCSLHGK